MFNKDISKWDVSNVRFMVFMFRNSEFNKDISDWDVSSVRSMVSMFQNSEFNKDISDWDVSNVLHMASMFQNSEFNNNIDDWKDHLLEDVDVSKMFFGNAYNPCWWNNDAIQPCDN